MAIERHRNALPAELKGRLDAAHGALLKVHKALLDHERTRYERERGPAGGPLAFLKIVMEDPFFGWLRPVSELIVQIDEATASRGTGDAAAGEALLKEARELMAPAESGGGFQREYHRALGESQEVLTAHGEWKRVAG